MRNSEQYNKIHLANKYLKKKHLYKIYMLLRKINYL